MGRMKPSFFIAGFQKCGTTTLYRQLMECDACVPGLLKENNMLAEPGDRLEEYRLSFPYRRGSKITGDASHLSTWSPHALPRLSEHFPNAKVLLILRDPAERAYSHFNMDQKTGYVPAHWNFEDYIEVEMSLRKRLKHPDDVHAMANEMRLFHSKYGWAISRSIYAPWVKAIQQGPWPLHIIFLSDLQDQYEATMRGVMDFLGIEEKVPAPQQLNKGNYRSPIQPETYQMLMQYFEPYDRALETTLDRKLPWR